MRSELRPLALALLLLGCGDYSNHDVLFFSALPTREDIKSNLPEAAAPPLRGAGAVVEQAVRAAAVADVPALGNRARLYDDTRNAANVFSALAEAFVGLVEEVQRHRPTVREADRRVWGPFPVADSGHEARVTITRTAELFVYRFELRPSGAEEDAFQAFIEGEFLAQGSLGEGVGEFHLENRVLLEAGLARQSALGNIDWIHLEYDTLSTPKTVTMDFTAILDTLRYSHTEYPDGSGSMHFVYDDAFNATFDVHSRWLGTGQGRADAEVTIFLGGQGTLSQCWDDTFRLTFHESDFDEPPLLGDVSGCPSGLPE